MTLAVNNETTLAEVNAAFRRYETALGENNVADLNMLFWISPHAVRYGAAEILCGFDEIAAFRAGRPSLRLQREIFGTVITTFGKDFATASTLFRRQSAPGKLGRQMQTWVRMAEGWRIVAAHVSFMDDADGMAGGRHEQRA